LNYYINEIFESDSIHIHVLALLGKESVAKEEYRSSFNKCLDFQREFQLIKPDFSLLLKRVLDENLQNRDAFINQINSFLQ
jgi:hypothetical protein